MKKALALILSLMMIMSVCSVSATFVEDPGVTTGVLLSDDFESWTQPIDARRTPSSTGAGGFGPYNSVGGQWPLTVDGDKVWASQSGDTGQSLWYANNRAGATTIDSGKLSISFNLEVAGGYEGVDSFNGVYPSVYIDLWTTTATIQCTIANTSDSRNGGGAIGLKTGGYSISTEQVANETVTIFDADTEYEVEILIDYEENKTQLLMNGTVVEEKSGATPFLANGGEFGILTNGAAIDTNFPADDNGMKPYIYIDDLKLERIGGEEPEEPEIPYVPSTELTEPVVLMNEDFTDVTEFTADMWRTNASTGAVEYVGDSTIADGVVNLTNQAYPCFRLPATTTTDIYELSYDVKGEGGRLVVYDYSVGSGTSSANMACYKPGSGVVAGVDAGDAANIPAADASKWYTIKVEWCADASNRYMYYSVYDKETNEKLGYFERYGKWVTGEGKDVSNYMPLQSMMLWNDKMTSCQVDNIVVKQLPVGYGDYKVYQPQIWVDDVLATTETTVNVGSVIESQAYGPAGSVLVLAAYDANGELVATATSTAAIRDKYNFKVTATADDFAGAASLKLFFFAGLDAGFKPVTTAFVPSAPVA